MAFFIKISITASVTGAKLKKANDELEEKYEVLRKISETTMLNFQINVKQLKINQRKHRTMEAWNRISSRF